MIRILALVSFAEESIESAMKLFLALFSSGNRPLIYVLGTGTQNPKGSDDLAQVPHVSEPAVQSCFCGFLEEAIWNTSFLFLDDPK
jgi:hypothetical protein